MGRPHPVPLCQALCHGQACPVPPLSQLTQWLHCTSQHRPGGVVTVGPPPHSTHRHRALPECTGGAPGWAGRGPGGQDGSRRRLRGAASLCPAIADVSPAWWPLVPKAGHVSAAWGAGAGGVGCGAGTADSRFWWGEGQGAGRGQAVSCERRERRGVSEGPFPPLVLHVGLPAVKTNIFSLFSHSSHICALSCPSQPMAKEPWKYGSGETCWGQTDSGGHSHREEQRHGSCLSR